MAERDKIQAILDKQDLWDSEQSKISTGETFSRLCWRYAWKERPQRDKIIGTSAAVEAYDGLKDVLRGIESAKDCIDALNFGMAKDHLNAAAWHVAQVKKAIALVGQSRNEKASRS